MIRITEVVKHLLIINVLMFVVFKMIFPQFEGMMGLYMPASSEFRPFQIVTHMFMHADGAHLFFNLFALYMFGSAVELVWGPKRFLVYYLFCGFGAAILHLAVKYYGYYGDLSMLSADQVALVQEEGRALLMSGQNYRGILGDFNMNVNTAAVGASGAIFGLLLAFGMLFPENKIFLIFLPIPIAAKYFIPILMLVELFLGMQRFAGDNVAHFAHLGGALFGFIFMKFWHKFPGLH